MPRSVAAPLGPNGGSTEGCAASLTPHRPDRPVVFAVSGTPGPTGANLQLSPPHRILWPGNRTTNKALRLHPLTPAYHPSPNGPKPLRN